MRSSSCAAFRIDRILVVNPAIASHGELWPSASKQSNPVTALLKSPEVIASNIMCKRSLTRPQAAQRRCEKLIALVNCGPADEMTCQSRSPCTRRPAVRNATRQPARKSSPDGVRPGPRPRSAVTALRGIVVSPLPYPAIHAAMATMGVAAALAASDSGVGRALAKQARPSRGTCNGSMRSSCSRPLARSSNVQAGTNGGCHVPAAARSITR